jgi:hypothetical protein
MGQRLYYVIRARAQNNNPSFPRRRESIERAGAKTGFYRASFTMDSRLRGNDD